MEFEIIFYGLAFGVACIINIAYILKRSNNNSVNKISVKKNLSSVKSLKSFDQFQSLENGDSKELKKVYSNGQCPHCGKYLDLRTNHPRYFAFDCNVCRACYSSLMRKHDI